MTRYHGRHRKPTATGRTVAKIAVTGMVVGAPLTAFAGTASAATGAQWDAVAQCESGGNYAINTGNGFSGGFQFTPSTWSAFGGQGAPQNATRDQQIQVAERVLAGQGKGAWPVCGKNLGAASPSSVSAPAQRTAAPAQRTAPTPQQSPKAAAPKAVAPKAVAPKAVAPKAVAPKATVARTAPASTTATGSYTVKSGDTLAKIAAAQGVSGGYQAIFALNQDRVQNVNLIFPGQTLRLP
jgi:LysM repeat protein